MLARFTAPIRMLALLVVCAAPAVARAQPMTPNVSPTAVDFGSVGVGTSSQGEPITLFNESGDTALTVTGGGLSGPHASQFQLEPALTAHTINAAESFILTLVRYAPTTTGAHAATLTINTSMGNVTVALAGAGVVAKIEVTPRDLQPFGDVLVGNVSTEQQITIANNGGTALNLVSVSLGGANPGSFALVSPPASGALDPAESVTFGVTCAPQNAGDLLAEVQIDSNDPGTPSIAVRLSCTGTVDGFTFAPGTIDFGNARVNTPVTATVTIQNTGAAFTLDGPTILPSGVDVFSLTNPGMPVGVASGNSATLTFTFNPTDESLSQAVAFMTLDYGGGTIRELQIPLRGRGVQPHVAVSATLLAFGEQRVATQGQLAVVVRNTGGAALELTELTGIAAPFTLLTPPTLPLTLIPNGEVTLNVAFTPADTGLQTGVLTISTDDPVNNSVDVTLTGTGIAPTLVVTSSTGTLQVEFGSQRRMTESEPETLTLLNTGTDVLALTAVTLAGPGKDAFVIAGQTSPTALVNGVPVTIELRFAPTAVDDYTATLTLASDDPEQPSVVVTLTGGGVAPQLAVTPGEDYAFSDTLVGKTSTAVTFEISNGDVTPLPLGEIRFKTETGDFVLDPGDVTGTLGLGQTVSFTVTFTPTATGTRQATLELVLADDPTPAVTIVVHGVGADAPGGGGCSVAAAGGAAPGGLGLLALLGGALARRRSRRP